MNDDLLNALRGVRQSPEMVALLYPQLYAARYWVLVQTLDSDVSRLRFLTYPADGERRALPVFTTPDRPRLLALRQEVPAAQVQPVLGAALWEALVPWVATGACDIALDPDEPHGIVVTRDMVEGVVAMCHGIA